MNDDDFGWLHSDRMRVGRRRRGVSVTELLDLSQGHRELVIEITRREPVSLRTLTEALDRDPLELEIQVSQMVAQGWLDVEEGDSGEWLYSTRLARHSKRVLPPGIWQVLDSQWQVPIFRLFPEAVLEEFSSSFRLQQFRPGTVLFETGDWGESLYLVEEGRIELRVYNPAGDHLVVREITAGDMLGELAVLRGERRPYAAHVVEETQAWNLNKRDLDALLARYPVAGLTIRQELSRHLKTASRPAKASSQYNPIVAVGEGAYELAQHLAEQTSEQVVLIDVGGQHDPDSSRLVYVDGQGLGSKRLAQTIQTKIDSGSWVVVATPPRMTDRLMRTANIAELVIDMTASGAPWLRATARQHWVMPSSTPLQMARLARRLCGQVTALVLSGGMARTIAHLGVLDILHSQDIPIDLHASCGYGALWSTLYASGWSPAEIIDWALREASRLRPVGKRLGLRPLSRLGLFDARSTRGLIQSTIGDLRFSDLETPVTLAASDLDTGQVVWLKQGPLFNALSACIATPGLITPIEHQEQFLVDATLTNPLPADAAVTGGADIILASSVIPGPAARQQGRQAQDLVTGWLSLSAAVSHQLSLNHLNAVDVLIVPKVDEFSDLAFDQAERLVERGRQAAEHSLPRIRSLLRQEEVRREKDPDRR